MLVKTVRQPIFSLDSLFNSISEKCSNYLSVNWYKNGLTEVGFQK